MDADLLQHKPRPQFSPHVRRRSPRPGVRRKADDEVGSFVPRILSSRIRDMGEKDRPESTFKSLILNKTETRQSETTQSAAVCRLCREAAQLREGTRPKKKMAAAQQHCKSSGSSRTGPQASAGPDPLHLPRSSSLLIMILNFHRSHACFLIVHSSFALFPSDPRPRPSGRNCLS